MKVTTIKVDGPEGMQALIMSKPGSALGPLGFYRFNVLVKANGKFVYRNTMHAESIEALADVVKNDATLWRACGFAGDL